MADQTRPADARQAQDPRQKDLIPVEGLQTLVDPDEDLLRHVPGLLGVAHVVAGDRVHARLEEAHQRLPGEIVSPAATFQEGGDVQQRFLPLASRRPGPRSIDFGVALTLQDGWDRPQVRGISGPGYPLAGDFTPNSRRKKTIGRVRPAAGEAPAGRGSLSVCHAVRPRDGR